MERGERLTEADVVALLRCWLANGLAGKIEIAVQDRRIVGIRPSPYLRSATDFRRHLPEVKQAT